MTNLTQTLATLGLRVTDLRLELLKHLSETAKPATVGELVALLRNGRSSVNKTTVYRQVERLTEAGLLKRVSFGDRADRYEVADLPHHHHLICRRCDSVEDAVLEDELTETEKRLGRRHGFLVERHTLEFHGLCAACR